MKTHTTNKKLVLIDRCLVILTIVMVIASCMVYGTIFKKTSSKTIDSSDSYKQIYKISELVNVCSLNLNISRNSLYLAQIDDYENYIEFDNDNKIKNISITVGYKIDKYYYYRLILEKDDFVLEYLNSYEVNNKMLRYLLKDLASSIQLFPQKDLFKNQRVNVSTLVLHNIEGLDGYFFHNGSFEVIKDVLDPNLLKGDFSYFTLNGNTYYYDCKKY